MEISDFIVSVRIFHPSKSADEIASLMSIPACVRNSVGSQRRTPKGALLKGIYSRTLVVFDLTREHDSSLPEFLEARINDLFSNDADIEDIVRTGGDISFYISLFCVENCGLSLDVSLLSLLGAKHIRLDFDIYPDKK